MISTKAMTGRAGAISCLTRRARGYNNWREAWPLYGTDTETVEKAIAEKTMGFLTRNGNTPVSKWKLCNYLKQFGFNEYSIKRTIENLIHEDILEELKADLVRLTDSENLTT